MARPEHLIRLAQKRLIRDAAELEIELNARGHPSYYMTLYRRFRNAAAESLAALSFIDPTDHGAIAALQRDVKVFDRFVEETKKFIADGKALEHELNEQEREEVLQMLLARADDSEQNAIDLGLIDPGNAAPDA